MQKGFLTVILVSLSALNPALATTVAATLTDWGLPGTWAIDCGAAPGKGTSARLRFVARPDGTAVHFRDFGDRPSSDKVKAARITPEGWLEMKIFFNGLKKGEEDRTFALEKLDAKSIRAGYNHNAKGIYTIKDGKLTASGNDSLVQHKCD